MAKRNTESTKEDSGFKSTKLKICTCDHPYQDIKYGIKKRVMNPAPAKKGFRCTVCARLHN